MADGSVPRISAVIACYKDAPAIPQMHQRLSQVFAALAVDHEIIFVNDGSPDDTAAILGALTAQDHHVIAVEHSRNFGSQSAFLSGMEVATGDVVVLLDGDLQDPPEVIPAMYASWRQGNDVVYGRRVKRDTSIMLAIAYKLFYRIFRRLSYVPIPLDAGDFSLLDRTVVEHLLAFPETEQFLRGLRAWVGFKQTGVDYVRPQRPYGRSTHGWLKDVWWAKKAIFSFSFAPLELLSYGAALLTLLAVAGIGYEIIDSFRRPQVRHGIAILIVLVLLFGSLNLLAVSLLGEYLMKIFEEVKRRPRFIRRGIWYAGKAHRSAAELASFVEGRKAARRATELRGRQ